MAQGASPAQAAALLRDTYRVSAPRRALAMDCARASLAAQNSLRRDEVSLYVGIPFCPTRCAYCSFVSADVGRALRLIDPFLAALHREISAAGAMLERAGLRVRDVYKRQGRGRTWPGASPAPGGAAPPAWGNRSEAGGRSGCSP